ncbi:alpha/beta hydrolase [Roseomonas rosulenta]|uniref:alpha/beta hydrolase n=1 Tax=Roseomonas rosulenta TaxID=2748667 RepID=UPI0018DF0388|nr:alpha/beta hydrolase [Roseomonas rosulenta]
MDLQAEYDNRARVPGSAAILEHWSRDAQAFRTTWARSLLDLPYGEGARERFDLFLPDHDGQAPLAVFIHGGYWQALDRKAVSHFARGMLLRGVAVAVPSYDLCPGVPLARIIEQMQQFCAILCARTQQSILAVGHSAGGHLAACLLGQDFSRFAAPLGRLVVPGALPISGVFELEPLLGTTIGQALNLSPETARALSPRFQPRAEGALHVVVGAVESDEFRRQSRDFAQAWGGTLEEVAGANHFTVLEPLTDPDSALSARAAEMARRLASL